MTARGPPTFDDGAHKYCRRSGVLGQLPPQDAYARTPGRVRRASWRAASSFPLVNYLPVAPVHEPECQLVNHVRSYTSCRPRRRVTKRDGRGQWRWNRVWPQGLKTARVTVLTSTGSAPNGARVTAMPVGADSGGGQLGHGHQQRMSCAAGSARSAVRRLLR
jgi:hypothetical protein